MHCTPSHAVNLTIMSVLVLSLLVVPTGAQNAVDKARNEKFAGEAAWQKDETLAEKWQGITGRFIFQRACLSCHTQGPAAFTKTDWQSKLTDFPDQSHLELLPTEFEDLTAMFPYGRMVANDRARYQSLEAFVIEHAPERKIDVPEAGTLRSIDLLPSVGQEAPDFAIEDVNGKKHTLEQYTTDKQALVLVFSRAHW